VQTSHDIRRRADAAQSAEPIRIEVDLSQPGTYSGEFVHSFLGAHDEALRIQTEPTFATTEEARASVAGLKGRVTFTTLEGVVAHERELNPEWCGSSWVTHGNAVPAFSFYGLDKGTYRMTLIVEEGAPALAGVPQTLVARYELCGLEYLPAEICVWASIACFLIAGVIVVSIVAVILLRKVEKVAESADRRQVGHSE
jgi:hypothetical protein